MRCVVFVQARACNVVELEGRLATALAAAEASTAEASTAGESRLAVAAEAVFGRGAGLGGAVQSPDRQVGQRIVPVFLSPAAAVAAAAATPAAGLVGGAASAEEVGFEAVEDEAFVAWVADVATVAAAEFSPEREEVGREDEPEEIIDVPAAAVTVGREAGAGEPEEELQRAVAKLAALSAAGGCSHCATLPACCHRRRVICVWAGEQIHSSCCESGQQADSRWLRSLCTGRMGRWWGASAGAVLLFF